MAVTLRLARHGQKKRPFYRIVAAEKTSRRDGRFLEIVGHYNPLGATPVIFFKEEKVRQWIEAGAQPTDTVRKLISKKLEGYIEGVESTRKAKILAARKARKDRAKARAQK